MLDRHQDRAAPLAADSEALCHSQYHQQYRRPDPYVVIGRQTADQKSGYPHYRQRKNQHGFAANLVTKMAADYASDGPGRKPDCIGAKRGERAGQGVVIWKEEFVEDERAGRSVEKEVIPLDSGADEARNGDPSDRCVGGRRRFQISSTLVVGACRSSGLTTRGIVSLVGRNRNTRALIRRKQLRAALRRSISGYTPEGGQYLFRSGFR